MKKYCWILGVAIALVIVSACATGTEDSTPAVKKNQTTNEEQAAGEKKEEAYQYINVSGKILKTRINVPAGYKRTKEKKDGLADFLRNYPLKKEGSPILLYDGSKRVNQENYVAIFKLPIEKEDLQQCADSVMRVYGEYYYKKQQYANIKYSLGGGFVADFSVWSRGRGIGVRGDTFYWRDAPQNDTTYASFQRFMRIVFAYSGTLNLEETSKKIKTKEMQVGDVFLKGGSPGHVVMIVDMCENKEGKKAFLLAQGFMPAQEFHIVKNPRHGENPWYYVDEVKYPFETAEYIFDKGTLRRLLSPR